MKTGRTLSELAAEIERQQTSKKDYLADTTAITFTPQAEMALKMNGTLPLTQLCHQQVASKVAIPQRYYDKMLTEAPDLLAANVNRWLTAEPDRRLVRTLDGKARAFLSDRYRPLDNYDLAQVLLPMLSNLGCKVESCEITETRMYLKAVTDRVYADIKVGDRLQAGICVSNSEVGAGALRVEPLVFRLVCLNGMVVNDMAMKKYHIGRRQDGEDTIQNLLSDEARQADDRAFWLKVRDIVAASMDAVRFGQLADKMREATERPVRKVVESVEVLSKTYGLGDEEKAGVLHHLIAGGDLSQYGMMNAITRTSQDVAEYERATQLETLGGTILMLPQNDWKVIAEAA